MFECLSNDVLQHINEKLDAKSLCNLARVSKRFRNLINEEQRPWKALFPKHFTDTRYSIVLQHRQELEGDVHEGIPREQGLRSTLWGIQQGGGLPWQTGGPLLMPKLRSRIIDGNQQWYTVSRGGKENSGSGAAAC